MLKTFLAATAVLAALAFNPAFAEEAKMTRLIALSGHGETRVTPDMATISVGVVSSAETAKAALAANTADMNSLMDALKSAGVEAKDMQTSNFSVNPRYDYGQNGGQPPKLVGYDVANSVTIIVRKIDTMGALLDKAVSSGSNQINGISFGVVDTTAAMDAARKLAVNDATRKAKLYAEAAGVSLGDVTAISEQGGYTPPPMMMKGRMMSASDAAAPVPMAQGEQVIAVDVNMEWQIK